MLHWEKKIKEKKEREKKADRGNQMRGKADQNQ